jgi:hypothetical protein
MSLEDLFVKIEKFRGLSVNQILPLILGSFEKVPKMKVVQFFKTYNFHVVQICIRSKDFEIFLNLSNLLKCKRTQLYFYNCKGSFMYKYIFL